MTSPREPARASRKRTLFAVAPLLTLGLTLTGLGVAGPAQAVEDRHGIDQVVINPGGGLDDDGADGLRVVLNLEEGSYDDDWAADASDQLFFENTVQFCCGGVGPNLNIGGDLYGESGASDDEGENSWDSLTVVSTSGSVERGTSTTSATGSGAATLRYTAVKGALTYTMDRTVSYTYPNDYYTDSYTFTIPTGNTDVVKFYKGGDTAPGSDDEGYGIQLTSPVRSVISLNPDSHIQVGQREIAGDKPFDGAVTEDYYTPYDDVADGNDLGFVTEDSEHDAGFMTQWNLGSTPGTQTHAQETFVNEQAASLNAGFRSGTVAAGSAVLLDLNVVNTLLTDVSPVGYTFTLPAGMVVAAGTPANACGGTLTATPGSSTITLSGGSVLAADNCVTSVPVVAAGGGSYEITQASATGLTGVTNGVGSSTLTATGPVAPPAPVTPGTPTSVTAVADQSSIVVAWHAPTSGGTPARYRVTASPGSASCTTTGLTCVLGGVAGTSYTITVVPLDANGVEGTSASVTTTAVATPVVPAAPPADAPLTLTTTDGQITTADTGQQITVVGTGFLPYSTATIVIYSTPITLGTVTTDASGNFSKPVTIPAGLEAGQHSLLAYGVDPSGDPHSLRLNITVSAAGAVTAVTDDSGKSLAYTGSTFHPLPVALGAGVLLLGGVALLLVTRSRRRAPSAR